MNCQTAIELSRLDKAVQHILLAQGITRFENQHAAWRVCDFVIHYHLYGSI
jgi:hypothetical protein